MTAERILVVDDEPQILRFLKPSLTAAGYDVITAANGREALRLATTHAPAAILLDLGLPDVDGKEVISKLRSWSRIPIIIVSARDQEAEKIAALDLGADDYVDKPFSIGELLARLRAALRSRQARAIEVTSYTAGALIVDLAAHKVVLDGVDIKLTPKEFELLALLVRHQGRVITHAQILMSIWGPSHADDVQYLRVFVRQLRQKLGRGGEPLALIQTEPGIGYRLQV